jgi:uncharacterized protein (TIGR03437 family)
MRALRQWPVFLVFAASAYAQSFCCLLGYSTYVGGGSADSANAIAVDAQGNVYIAGQTVSSNFPVTPGAFQSKQAGVAGQVFLIGAGQISDAFVTKIDPTGKIVYSTYLGGSSTDVAKAIAVDAQGNVYVAGTTNSPDFPVTAGGFQTSASFVTNGLGQSHIFVTKLNASGSALLYSTFIAGSGTEQANAIAVDSAGNAYLTGTTTSLDFPVTKGALQTSAAQGPAFSPLFHGYVAKLNAAGSGLEYATYLSGSDGAQPNGLALAANSEVVIAGSTSSSDFPVTQGAFQMKLSGEGAFASRLNSQGSGLVYSTFLAGGTSVSAVALGSAGEVYLTGVTSSSSFPVTAGAMQTSFPGGSLGGSAGYVAELSALGSSLEYATFLGGPITTPYAIVVDAAGNAWVGGASGDADLPPAADGYQTNYDAAPCSFGFSSPFQTISISVNCGDAFLTELNPAGSSALYSTYFGGNGGDLILGMALGAGGVYVTGSTESANLPATAEAASTHLAGGICTDVSSPTASSTFPCSDAFVAEFVLPTNVLTIPGVPGFFQVVNAASLLPGAIAPGELVTLLGAGIGPMQPADLTLTASGQVSTTLGGFQVLFNNTPAPLIHVDSSHITVVTPYEVAGKQQVQVGILFSGATLPFPNETIEIAQIDPSVPPVAPGLFTTVPGQVACLNQDGSVNGPTNPAAQGSEVAIFLTGLGMTVPPGVDGSVTSIPATGVSGLPMPTSTVLVYAGGKAARVVYAGAAPDLVSGVMQVNFIVPAVSGTVPVFVAAGSDVVSSQSGVAISVR